MRERLKTWIAERLPPWAQNAMLDWHLWRGDRHARKGRWWAALIERIRR